MCHTLNLAWKWYQKNSSKSFWRKASQEKYYNYVVKVVFLLFWSSSTGDFWFSIPLMQSGIVVARPSTRCKLFFYHTDGRLGIETLSKACAPKMCIQIQTQNRSVVHTPSKLWRSWSKRLHSHKFTRLYCVAKVERNHIDGCSTNLQSSDRVWFSTPTLAKLVELRLWSWNTRHKWISTYISSTDDRWSIHLYGPTSILVL